MACPEISDCRTNVDSFCLQDLAYFYTINVPTVVMYCTVYCTIQYITVILYKSKFRWCYC